MRRLNPTVIALLAGALILLLLIYVFTGATRTNSDKLTDAQAAGQAEASDPEKRCGTQKTYDLIKRELFRRAAQLRGSDQPTFDRLATYSVVRMDAPMLRSHDEDVGTVTCAGSLALDLPPGVAVVGGRRTLNANIGYAIQPAADGSGDVLTLSNADAIITPLATLARAGAPAGEPQTPGSPSDPALPPLTAEPSTSQPPIAQPPPVVRPPPPPARPQVTASPSFNCRSARTRGEIAVCGDSGLAALDRQMAVQFNSALCQADSRQRSLLQRTRSDFLRYRDNCPSNSCIAETYRGRIREIRDIMSGRWQAR
ncbi:MAG: lysozyme inhibitor LprI family protein [Sphingomicrobium sp.]